MAASFPSLLFLDAFAFLSLTMTSFFPLFDKYIYNLVNTLNSVRYATFKVLTEFRDDGVRYLELRTIPRAASQSSISKKLYVTTVLDCIAEFVEANGDDMSVYLILAIDRNKTATEAMETVDLAISLRSQGYHEVVGIDLCGNPAREAENILLLKPAFTRAKELGLHLTFHFAEIPASNSVEELETLLSFEPERIGHVIHALEHLRDEIAARGLGLELCLSCNVLGQLTQGGFGAHHFGEWWRRGCRIALGVSRRVGLGTCSDLLPSFSCNLVIRMDLELMPIQTDDVGVFGSALSNEYLLAALHFNLSKHDLIDLCRKASQTVFGGEKEMGRLQSLLQEFAMKTSLSSLVLLMG